MTALANLRALVGKWRKMASDCRDTAVRLDGHVACELERDAAQYEHCADQLEATLSPAELGGVEAVVGELRCDNEGGRTIKWRDGFHDVSGRTFFIVGTTPRAAEAEWLPIESAPVATDAMLTDVETCLVYGQKIGRQLGRAWRYVDGSAQAQAYGFHGFNDDITHWRPLPAPPSAKGENSNV